MLATPAHAGITASVTLAAGQPTSIFPSETTQLQITIANDNEMSAVTGVGFTNTLPGTLPNGLVVDGVSTYVCEDSTGSVATTGTFSAVDGSQSITLSGATIPIRSGGMDSTCTLTIPVTAGTTTGASASYTYTIADGAVTGTDTGPVANTGSVSQSVNVRPLDRPVIDKTFASSSLFLGGASTTLTIRVTNPNTVALTGYGVSDTFPTLGAGGAIMQVAGTPSATSTCTTGASTPATFTPSAGDVVISATGGTIAAGETCTITVQVEGRQTNNQYDTGLQNNTINGATDFASDIGLVPLNETAQVRVFSPLNVTKAFTNGSMASGESNSFSITFSNSSTSPLVVDTFSDSPIDGVGDLGFGLKLSGTPTMSCPSGTPGTLANTVNDVGFTLTSNATIAAGGSCTITGTFVGTVQTANTPRTYTNSIAQGAVGTVASGIVSRAVSASVLVVDTLRVLKTSTPNNVAPGNPVRYTATVQNWSSSAISNLTIVDTLANNQTYLTGTINGVNYTPTLSGSGCADLTTPATTGANSVTFTVATVPARSGSFSPASCAVTFYAMTDPAAVDGSAVTNTLPAGSVCYNSGATCNGGSASAPSRATDADVLTVTKTFDPAGPLAEGSIATMRINLFNRSANPMTSASVSDTLPLANTGGGQMRIASPPNAATNCGGTPGIVAVADSTSLEMNSAIIPARASNGLGALGDCFVQVDVVAPAGIYDNTASAAATQTLADGTTASVGPITADAQLTYNSSLAVAKSFAPASVSSGGMSTVTVRLNNTGAQPISNIQVTDPLPAGMVLADPVNARSTCDGGPTFTGAAGASSITMSGADLAGSGTCDMLFNVIATGSTDWVNTIPVGNITADDGIQNQSPVVDTLVFDTPQGVTLAKATSPSTLTFPGEVSRLTVTLSNGTTAVTGISFTDYFTDGGTSGAALNGMQIAPEPNASTTCASGFVSADSGGTTLSLNGASLGASTDCEVSVDVISTAVGGITNTIPINSIMTDQGLTNSGAAITSLTTQGNIGITKQFTPGVIQPNERSRLRITFLNPTAQPASDLNVLDTMPAGVTIPSGANPTTTCTGATVSSPSANQVQVSGGTLPAASGGVSSSCYAEIDVTSSAQGTYVNTIPAGDLTATIGGAPAMNAQPASATLRVKLPLEIHKAVDSLTLDSGNPAGFTTGTASRAVGAPATLTIALINPNSENLTAASVSDILPNGLVVATTPNAGTNCASGVVNAPASSDRVILTGATIPASSSCNVTVDVLSNISGSYVNTIAAGDVTTFEGVTNDEPTSAQLIISTPPTVSKQFDPPVIGAGSTSTLTIFLGNDNDSSYTLSSTFTDTLPTAPGPVVVAGTPNVVNTCPGAVTAAAGAGTVSYANGATVPAGGCTISVDVTASTVGEHTNNIPAGDLQTSLGNNQEPANAILNVSTLGFVSGKVFQDNDVTPNGIFSVGTDTPLQGVSIELRSGATCAGALLDTKTTDSAGNYLFSELNSGTYSVCETTQPSGTVNGITTAGAIAASSGSTGTAGTASNPSATTSQIVGIVLNNDGAGGAVSGSLNNNFAEVVTSSIAGIVYMDENNNGVQNGADLGISGVTIQLLDAGGSVINTTTTAADGSYSFTDLVPGTYSVREPTQPNNTSNGITSAGSVANGGTAGTATNTITTPSQITDIILPPNTTAAANSFAELTNGRTINGSVFLDYNNGGTLDGSDYGLNNITIALSGTDDSGNPVSDTTTTDANGNYSFTGLPPGVYTLDQAAQPTDTTNGTTVAGTTGGTASNPTATSSRIAGINLMGANTLSASNNFPEVPGAAPDLTIAKNHTPSSFGEGSSTGVFTITSNNIGSVDSSGVITVVDTLPTGMTIAVPATGTGWSCTGAVGATSFTCTTSDIIAAASSGNSIRVGVEVANGTSGQLLTNNVVISGGSEPTAFTENNSASDTVAISDSARLSGTIWHDTDHDRVLDAGEEREEGWTVELLLNGTLIRSTITAADGTYNFTSISPGTGYQVQFRDPTNGVVFGNALPNEQGITPVNGVRDSGNANGGTNAGNPAGADLSARDGTLPSLQLFAGDNIIEQSLPLDPAGVVYDAITRQPVAGAVVTITGPAGFNPVTDLVGGSATFVTGADGMYQFLLTPTAPAGDYDLAITTYPSGYKTLPSTLIPVCTNRVTATPTPDPALIHVDATAPAAGAPIHDPATCPATTNGLTAANQATTQHYFQFTLDAATSGDVVNNHIPLDPIRAGDIVVTKTSPLVNVSVGQLVPYTITIQNTTTAAFTASDFVDIMPAGFKYKSGSAMIDGVAIEPTANGRTLTWSGQELPASTTRTIKLIMVVGTGVQPGEYVNRAQVLSNPGGDTISNVATATVRVIPDPLFDCSEIIGKVFDDKNTNGYQDQGEAGVANVRLATVNGLLVTTDNHGRFHIACAVIPDSDRGSNFLMKLDERTLPTGYRITTENPRSVRATRGKMTKINFGVAIHKVVRIDMQEDAFEAGSTTLKAEWLAQMSSVPAQLKAAPTIVRIAYLAKGDEGEALARKRLQVVTDMLEEMWGNNDCCHNIQIEQEFTQKGGAS